MRADVRTPTECRVPTRGPHWTIELTRTTSSLSYEASLQQLAADYQRLINLGTEGDA